MSIRDRFSSHKAILADFSLLDPERFQHSNSSKGLPPDAFQNVAHNYGVDDRKLKEEYISFVETYPKLRKPENDRRLKETPPSTASSNDDINRENFITVLNVLSNVNQLKTVYKTLVTLPIGSTKCERTFSKLN